MRINYSQKNIRPSLINFLSVLACVMATLMFLAEALSLTSLDSASRNIQVNVDYGSEMESGNAIVLECTYGIATSLDGELVFDKWTEENVNDSFDNTPFAAFLNVLADSSNQDYIFFLIRPDGIDIYEYLSSILNNWNKKKNTNSAIIPERINKEKFDLLPEKLKQRINFNNYELYSSLAVTKVLSNFEKDLLSGLVTEPESKTIISKLYEATKTATSWIDFGSELVPKDWNVKVSFEKETSQNIIKIEK